MVIIHFDLVSGPFGPFRTQSGPLGPPVVSNSTFYGQNRTFLPGFDRFIKLGGSIWAITVLDKEGIPLRCSGHPTILYSKKNIQHKIGPWKFWANGHFGQKGDLSGPPGGQVVVFAIFSLFSTGCPKKMSHSNF